MTHNAFKQSSLQEKPCVYLVSFCVFNCITPTSKCVCMTIQKCTVVCLQITFHMLVINIERIISFEHIIAALFCFQFASVNLIHFLITFGIHIHFANFHSCMALFKETFGQSKEKKKKKRIHKEAAVPLVAAVACVKKLSSGTPKEKENQTHIQPI